MLFILINNYWRGTISDFNKVFEKFAPLFLKEILQQYSLIQV